MASIVLDHLHIFYNLLFTTLLPVISDSFHQRKNGSLAQGSQMICPSAHNSYCQSQMFSDLSVVYLDHGTWLWPPSMKCLTSGFVISLPTTEMLLIPLQLYTSQSFVHLGVGKSGLSVHISVLEILIQFTVCTFLPSFLNY